MTVVTVAAAVISIIGVLVALIALFWLHTKPTGLNPVTDAVSEYGISPFRSGYRLATVALGIAAAALAIALLAEVDPPNILATIIMLLFAGARLLISWSPMDRPGTARTPSGTLHNVLAIVFFAAATLSAFLYSASFSSPGPLYPLETFSSVLSWVMAVFSVGVLVTTVGGSLKGYFGFAERMLYLSIFVWMLGIAVGVLVLA